MRVLLFGAAAAHGAFKHFLETNDRSVAQLCSIMPSPRQSHEEL